MDMGCCYSEFHALCDRQTTGVASVCMYVCPQLTKIACRELTCLYQFNVQARSLRAHSLTIARNCTRNEKGDGTGVKKFCKIYRHD